MIDAPYFAERLRVAMAKKDMSVAELARRIGVNRASVAPWMRGSGHPSPKQVLAIVKVLEMESDQSEANRFVSNNIVVSNYDLMSLHWMARRYADGRSSYSPGLFNGITKKLIAAGAELKAPLFARDGMGRRYDGLTSEQAEEAESDMPRGFVPEADERLKDALEALEELLPSDWRDGTMDHMPGVAKARMALNGHLPSKVPGEEGK